jgi:hypothetical protein
MAKTITVTIQLINRNRAILQHPIDPDECILLDLEGCTQCGKEDFERELVLIPSNDENDTSLSEVLYAWAEDVEEAQANG